MGSDDKTVAPQAAQKTASLVEYAQDDGVATLRLNNGKVNAISPALIADFNLALDQAEQDGAVVVITGQSGILSGGFDLKVLQSGPREALDLVAQGFRLARRLLSHTRPVIIACPGHAVAMGAFLLLTADYRIGVQGPFSIALNEVKIGMTMPHIGLVIARDRLTPAAFQRATLLAEVFNPDSAREAGFLDQVVAPEELMASAYRSAELAKGLDARAHRQSKLRARQGLLQAMDAAEHQDRTSLAG